METMLIRVYCLLAAVELNELQVESRLVARVMALEDETKAVPINERPAEWRVAIRAAWRGLRDEVEAAARQYHLTTPALAPTLYERRRRALDINA